MSSDIELIPPSELNQGAKAFIARRSVLNWDELELTPFSRSFLRRSSPREKIRILVSPNDPQKVHVFIENIDKYFEEHGSKKVTALVIFDRSRLSSVVDDPGVKKTFLKHLYL